MRIAFLAIFSFVLVSFATVAMAITCSDGTQYPSSLPITFSDDFNDNSLNTSLWNTLALNGTILAEQNQRLEITISNSLFGEIYYKRNVAGDFDFEVDYELLTWPAS